MRLVTNLNALARAGLVALLVASISALHYYTAQSEHYQHLFYQELYFLPLILAGFWFSMRGALITTLAITLCYFPFIVIHWTGFSPDDFNRLLGIMLYNVIGAVLGILRKREKSEQDRRCEIESLAAMGQAVSGLAHDMKTPLIAIGGFSRLVQKRHKEGDESYEKLGIVIKETQRLENMVKEMLDFARPLELHRSVENIGQLLSESLEVVESAASEYNVKAEIKMSKPLPDVSLDAMRMKQVLINLVMNGVQASPEGGTVRIHASEKGKRLIIDVSDNGCGVPVDRKKEIFSPFFTTKKDGTGLGLPIAKKIVEAHSGRIVVLNNPGKGLTFRIVMPMRAGD
jgi:signal transduction histidine kinase